MDFNVGQLVAWHNPDGLRHHPKMSWGRILKIGTGLRNDMVLVEWNFGETGWQTSSYLQFYHPNGIELGLERLERFEKRKKG